MKTIVKPSFAILGREGSTREGKRFMQRLWQETNAHFDEISTLVLRGEDGCLIPRAGLESGSSVMTSDIEYNLT